MSRSLKQHRVTHWCLSHAADVLTIALLVLIIVMIWRLKL
jgi:hypothetical protein